MDLLTNRSVLDDLVQNILYFDGAFPYILCFDESTEILCLNENFAEVYKKISELKIGDFVKSFKHGFRRIEIIFSKSIINNVDDFQSCMYLMPKNKEMTKDLIVTGGHSILVDSMTHNEDIKNKKYFGNDVQIIDNKKLLLAAASNKFTPLTDNNEYNIYNFCLENDGDDEARYGVWANGVLVETPAINYLKKIFSK